MGKSLRDVGRGMSKEQELMRDEMAKDPARKPAKPEDPAKLGEVFEQEFGFAPGPEDADISRMAHLLIEEHGQGLFLDIGAWTIVQRIVEAAVRVEPADL